MHPFHRRSRSGKEVTRSESVRKLLFGLDKTPDQPSTIKICAGFKGKSQKGL